MRLFLFILLGGLFVSCNSSNTSSSAQQEEVEELETVADPAHTSRNSLDWAGTYKGELPCKDCDAIDMEITISDDDTFVVKAIMKGKDEVIEDSGDIQWENNDSHIHLIGDIVDYHFRVGENQLTFLIEAGIIPDDALLKDYTLEKVE